MTSQLARRLGAFDAVVIGLGSMIGAGVFAAIGPAAGAAGSALLVGLGVAAVVAYCNATSSAQLAALYPRSGGTYVYGRERLGDLWGFLAGWGFVVGKTASCAAMAMTFGAYVAPDHARWFAVLAVAGLAAVNYAGIERTALATRVLVALVLAALAVVVVACLAGGAADTGNLDDFELDGRGILQSAGLLFFAFAGYARIATLGDEVVDPERTIPRAIPTALGITLFVYAAVAVAALLAAGPRQLADSSAPLASAVQEGRFEELASAVRVGAALASVGVLLSLLAGVSRTTFAMALNRDLWAWLDAVHPRRRVPHRAELVIAGLVIVVASMTDVRGAIGFSSFAVLVYYAITNAAAWTLAPAERKWPRLLSAAGFAGCVVLAINLPVASVVTGAVVLVVGVALRTAARSWRGRSHRNA